MYIQNKLKLKENKSKNRHRRNRNKGNRIVWKLKRFKNKEIITIIIVIVNKLWNK